MALAIMAVIATLSWQGLDSMLRTREVAQGASQATLRLSTVIAQWEQDLLAVHDAQAVPALVFDGATLRLTRRSPDGVQMVAWSLREGRWVRWAAAPVRRVADLQDAWLRSHQWLAGDEGSLRMLADARGWRLHFYRGGGWSNAQSSGDLAPAAALSAASASAPAREQLPQAVRLMIDLPAGTLTRDVILGPQRP